MKGGKRMIEFSKLAKQNLNFLSSLQFFPQTLVIIKFTCIWVALKSSSSLLIFDNLFICNKLSSFESCQCFFCYLFGSASSCCYVLEQFDFKIKTTLLHGV